MCKFGSVCGERCEGEAEISLLRCVGEPGAPEAGLSSVKEVRSASPACELAGAAAAVLGGLFGGNMPIPWLMLVLGVRFMAATSLREQWPDGLRPVLIQRP